MNNSNYSTGEQFQMWLLPSMYGIEFCVALLGNVFALWLLVTKERKNWHTGVVLSCNLAISDLLYVLTLPLLIVYYTQRKNWPFGTAMCKTERFLFTCNLYVSIFFIVCISVNRYVAIVHPFFTRTYVRPAHAKAVSLFIWIGVTALSSPVLAFATTCGKGNVTYCVSHCEMNAASASAHFKYKLFLALFGCFVPFLITFASYCGVVWVVWRNANISTQVSKGLAALNMCIHPLLYMCVFNSIQIACCRKG